jgi:hypothetical protein
MTSSMTRRQQRLEFRRYSDWRWRLTSDHLGLALWCGPVAVYWWRRRDRFVAPQPIRQVARD